MMSLGTMKNNLHLAQSWFLSLKNILSIIPKREEITRLAIEKAFTVITLFNRDFRISFWRMMPSTMFWHLGAHSMRCL
jgi:hypothetical protein